MVVVYSENGIDESPVGGHLWIGNPMSCAWLLRLVLATLTKRLFSA
jgi:hypothetical protein